MDDSKEFFNVEEQKQNEKSIYENEEIYFDKEVIDGEFDQEVKDSGKQLHTPIEKQQPNFEKRNFKSKCKSFKISKTVMSCGISSIAGGLLVGIILMIFQPIIQPALSNSIGGLFGTYDNQSAVTKKIQIEKSTSPLVAIAEKVGPSVAGIKVTVKSTDSFFGPQVSNPQGSAIIVRSDGYIMTNNHVIADALVNGTNQMKSGSKIEVVFSSKKDKPVTAMVVGRDEKTDLAVLKVNTTNLPAAEFGDSDKVKVGDLAVAIGNPGGLEYMGSVTAGIISGLNRTIPVEDGKELKLIQTDAAINPGNSGGALVNGQGQVIGINTAKIGGQGYEGLGFAIPSNKAKEIVNSLIEFKYVKGRPLLGITAEPRYTEDFAKQQGLPVGVYVADVSMLTGAYKAGIKIGDIITKFDGKQVKTVGEINEFKNIHKPGDKIDVEIYRNGDIKKVVVILSEEGSP